MSPNPALIHIAWRVSVSTVRIHRLLMCRPQATPEVGAIRANGRQAKTAERRPLRFPERSAFWGQCQAGRDYDTNFTECCAAIKKLRKNLTVESRCAGFLR